MVSPEPKSKVPSVTQDCPAVVAVVWQYAAPDVTRSMLKSVGADVVGADVVGVVVGPGVVGLAVGAGVGAVVGLVGATVGEAVGTTAPQHSTQPLLVTELSVRHVKVSFSATRTLCGPDVPRYEVPLMVT